MPKIINYSEYIGKKFYSYTILEDLGLRHNGKQMNRIMLAKCDCGNIREVVFYDVKRGSTKSCCKRGCIRHNKCYTPLYRIHSGIKTRCYNIKSKPYKNYGGRGIKMCNDWLNDVTKFIDWALENGYKKGLSIERINNDSDYEPKNCKWSTEKEQANNRRTNHNVEYRGVIMTISQLAEKYNMPKAVLRNRIVKQNIPIEKALTYEPSHKKSYRRPIQKQA